MLETLCPFDVLKVLEFAYFLRSLESHPNATDSWHASCLFVYLGRTSYNQETDDKISATEKPSVSMASQKDHIKQV